ncbi:hypothetical protein Tco_0361477, partial [Tanacetum coccineum]
ERFANTKEDFFSKTVNIIRECADYCNAGLKDVPGVTTVNIIRECADYCNEGLKDVPGVTCPTKPAGAMCVMLIK